MILKTLFTFCLTLWLAGCTTSTIEPDQPLNMHIIDVDVAYAENASATPSLPNRLRSALMHYAKAHNRLQSGQIYGYELKVTITEVHYKNAVASLLVGDANSMTVKGQLIDPDTNAVIQEFTAAYVDGASAVLNGVSGALLSAHVSKETADTTMIEGISPPIMQKAFASNPLPPNMREAMKNTDLFRPVEGPISPLSRQDEEMVAAGETAIATQ